MSARKLNLLKAIDFMIKIETGPDAGKAYKIQPPNIIIGREDKCQITLSDPKCSRQQLKIQFSDDVKCIDLSSRKTTLVNGKPGHNQALKPGDSISFGSTAIQFLAQTNQKAQPQLQGKASSPQEKEKDAGRKRLKFFMIAVVVLSATLLLLEEDPVGKPSQQLLTQKDVRAQIEESRERTNRLKESFEQKKRIKNNNYLQNVEKHFISGFRDFQNGQYGRAIDSFGTTIATDSTHARAQQYAKSAYKKRDDLVDTHMRDGAKYREKMMYNRCAAEFEKSIVLINDPNSKKDRLALTQLKECRLLKAGGN